MALVAIVIAVAVMGAACGGGSDSAADPRVLPAGQVDIKLPPHFKVVNNTVVAPKHTASAAATTQTTLNVVQQAGVTTTTAKGAVPIDKKSDPTGDMMKAMGKFRTCLDDIGVKFIGAPDASNPDSPTNDPAYIDGLSTCAARSNIVQAMQSAQAEEDTLTPAQIEERNKGFLSWRKCMIQRGWKISVPTPDSKGRLFSFSGGSGPQMTPPAGQDVISSTDVTQCADKVQAATARKAK